MGIGNVPVWIEIGKSL